MIELINEACAAGARQSKACEVVGLSERTLQRWQEADELQADGRKVAAQQRKPANALPEETRQEVLETVNQPRFASTGSAQALTRHRTRLCRLSPTKALILRRNRAYTAFFAKKSNWRIAVKPKLRQANAQSRWQPNALTRSGAGTSLTWRPPLRACIFTST